MYSINQNNLNYLTFINQPTTNVYSENINASNLTTQKNFLERISEKYEIAIEIFNRQLKELNQKLCQLNHEHSADKLSDLINQNQKEILNEEMQQIKVSEEIKNLLDAKNYDQASLAFTKLEECGRKILHLRNEIEKEKTSTKKNCLIEKINSLQTSLLYLKDEKSNEIRKGCTTNGQQYLYTKQIRLINPLTSSPSPTSTSTSSYKHQNSYQPLASPLLSSIIHSNNTNYFNPQPSPTFSTISNSSVHSQNSNNDERSKKQKTHHRSSSVTPSPLLNNHAKALDGGISILEDEIVNLKNASNKENVRQKALQEEINRIRLEIFNLEQNSLLLQEEINRNNQQMNSLYAQKNSVIINPTTHLIQPYFQADLDNFHQSIRELEHKIRMNNSSLNQNNMTIECFKKNISSLSLKINSKTLKKIDEQTIYLKEIIKSLNERKEYPSLSLNNFSMQNNLSPRDFHSPYHNNNSNNNHANSCSGNFNLHLNSSSFQSTISINNCSSREPANQNEIQPEISHIIQSNYSPHLDNSSSDVTQANRNFAEEAFKKFEQSGGKPFVKIQLQEVNNEKLQSSGFHSLANKPNIFRCKDEIDLFYNRFKTETKSTFLIDGWSPLDLFIKKGDSNSIISILAGYDLDVSEKANRLHTLQLMAYYGKLYPLENCKKNIKRIIELVMIQMARQKNFSGIVFHLSTAARLAAFRGTKKS
jgi:hypothetical protein